MTTMVGKDQTHAAQAQDQALPEQRAAQYTLGQILGIWLAGGVPIWALGWLVYPALNHNLSPTEAGLLRLKLLAIGLVWQFVLSLIILYREEGTLTRLRQRFWLNNPRSLKTGRVNNRLWWWLIPGVLLVVACEFTVSPALNHLWTQLFPFLAEPAGFGIGVMFAPEVRPQWVGAWGLLVLYVAQAAFNTCLGEEFLYRGVLLPKMNGVFGRWDWVANAVLFGLYHLHQPWGIPGDILTALVFAYPGRRFRSSWFAILLHSGQTIYFTFLILGLVLGLA